jgi:hypothetical protein
MSKLTLPILDTLIKDYTKMRDYVASTDDDFRTIQKLLVEKLMQRGICYYARKKLSCYLYAYDVWNKYGGGGYNFLCIPPDQCFTKQDILSSFDHRVRVLQSIKDNKEYDSD